MTTELREKTGSHDAGGEETSDVGSQPGPTAGEDCLLTTTPARGSEEAGTSSPPSPERSTLTFELHPTDDAELTCFVCSEQGCDREIHYYADSRGSRRHAATPNGGIIAAGEAANEGTFIAAVRGRIAALSAPTEGGKR